MADYKAMYQTLFSAMTDAIRLLSEAQQQAEDLYIEGGEPVPGLKPLGQPPKREE